MKSLYEFGTLEKINDYENKKTEQYSKCFLKPCHFGTVINPAIIKPSFWPHPGP
jgi:hypothetical protein